MEKKISVFYGRPVDNKFPRKKDISPDYKVDLASSVIMNGGYGRGKGLFEELSEHGITKEELETLRSLAKEEKIELYGSTHFWGSNLRLRSKKTCTEAFDSLNKKLEEKNICIVFEDQWLF